MLIDECFGCIDSVAYTCNIHDNLKSTICSCHFTNGFSIRLHHSFDHFFKAQKAENQKNNDIRKFIHDCEGINNYNNFLLQCRAFSQNNNILKCLCHRNEYKNHAIPLVKFYNINEIMNFKHENNAQRTCFMKSDQENTYHNFVNTEEKIESYGIIKNDGNSTQTQMPTENSSFLSPFAKIDSRNYILVNTGANLNLRHIPIDDKKSILFNTYEDFDHSGDFRTDEGSAFNDFSNLNSFFVSSDGKNIFPKLQKVDVQSNIVTTHQNEYLSTSMNRHSDETSTIHAPTYDVENIPDQQIINTQKFTTSADITPKIQSTQPSFVNEKNESTFHDQETINSSLIDAKTTYDYTTPRNDYTTKEVKNLNNIDFVAAIQIPLILYLSLFVVLICSICTFFCAHDCFMKYKRHCEQKKTENDYV